MAEDGLIKVPNVQRIKRANGRVDLYFRKGPHHEGPLKSSDGTPELLAEVEAILGRLAKSAAASKAPVAGTVGALLKAYNRSAEFRAIAQSTQAGYQDYIDELIEDCGEVLLSEVTRTWVIEMRNAWAVRGHRAANNRFQVLKNALAPAIDDDDDCRIKGDPFNRVKRVRRPHDAGEAHPMWEDHEVQAAIDLALQRKKPGLARAIALGRYGGFRRGTICTIPLNARTTGFDEAGRPHGRLYWITEKRKVLADKREDPRLSAILARTPNRALTIAYNARGEAWKPRQLNQAMDRIVDMLVKVEKARANLTIHGLRHSRGVELAQAGASDAEIMSQLEHATDRAAKIYRRQADRRRMADAGQDRVDKVVSIRARQAAKNAANGG
ncbi:tyrosine-type recombinase/integrase [Caulobacter sp. ErkDOM-YI]|uniref:tyrosine-type recombinase/integrase n=1 Tax=unclassified Caulobacter TaxID=2648921 RepID=UPI003AF67DBE